MTQQCAAWVQAIGSILVFLATVALVGVTWKYVSVTREMIRELEEGRTLTPLPVARVAIRYAPESPPAGGAFKTPDRNEIEVSNVGNAPALEVSISISLRNPSTSLFDIADESWALGTIASGDKRSVYTKTANLLPLPGHTEHPEVGITVTCRNVYGREVRTAAVLAAGDHPKWNTARGQPELEWSLLEEKTKILPRRSRAAG